MDIHELAGTRLGNYEIESLLGSGGIDVVYKARQLTLDRPVALRFLPPALNSDSSFIGRFRTEARAVAKLSHPNIVRIFDISKEEGLHFFSMEFFEGRNLADLLKERERLEIDEALGIVSQAAFALEHAHDNGIIHRDIKPANIMVDGDGNVKVVPFGVAGIAKSIETPSQPYIQCGTPGYMSPEQCRGEAPDHRTDIYSLGVVLYEMLTGSLPFEASDTAAMIQATIDDEPAELKSLNPDVPEALSAVVAHAMAKDRENRYASISDFLAAIRNFRAPTASPATLGGIDQLAGTSLGNYTIENPLGRGGMGMVYKARQMSLDRPVALKILLPTLSGDHSFVKRFHREALAVAKLNHPNIVQIFDISEAEGLHFFSMELIEGRTLDEILKEKGPLDADDALRIVTQAAHGLEHAHRNGIIHRDIKPSNIIVDNLGNAQVMDFGLAKLTGKTRLTRTATIMGTVSYMSPEQAHGESAIDHRTDIWSLGVMLYEMLTGKLPFDAPSDPGVIHKIIYEDPEPIRSQRDDIPAAMEKIVERTLRKDSQERYENMQALIDDLEAVRSGTATSSRKSSPSIAVLPFANMSADPDQEYFCDGLAEELINALTQIKDLKVIARTSAFSFRGKDIDVREIGKKLDVGTVLEGSLRKAGNRLRITAQLIDTARGHHLWSERYDRQMDDVFAVQDEITERIVDKLKPQLLGQEKTALGKKQVIDIVAYDLYLRGVYFRNKTTHGGLLRAIECFEQAVEKAPNYALAYAGLAGALADLAALDFLPTKDIYAKVRNAIAKALELDATLSEAHAELAAIKMQFEWDWDAAEREILKAIELNPGNAYALHTNALYLHFMSRFDEAIEQVLLAYELDPLSLTINLSMGRIYSAVGHHDKAIAVYQRMIEMEPDVTTARVLLAISYMSASMHEEALKEFEIVEKFSDTAVPSMRAYIGTVHAFMGNRDRALEIYDGLLELSETSYISPTFLAILQFALGNIDQGFQLLDKAYRERDHWLRMLGAHPIVDALGIRSDPRYQSLLKKIGLDK